MKENSSQQLQCSQCETILSSDLIKSRNFFQLVVAARTGEADPVTQGIYQIVNSVSPGTYIFCTEKCFKRWSGDIYRITMTSSTNRRKPELFSEQVIHNVLEEVAKPINLHL